MENKHTIEEMAKEMGFEVIQYKDKKFIKTHKNNIILVDINSMSRIYKKYLREQRLKVTSYI